MLIDELWVKTRNTCLILIYFAQDGLQSYPFSCKLHNTIFICDWIMLGHVCMHVCTHTCASLCWCVCVSPLFISWQTYRLIPCLIYCEYCSIKQRCVCDFHSFGYIPKNELATLYSSPVFHFLRNFHTHQHNRWTNLQCSFYIPKYFLRSTFRKFNTCDMWQLPSSRNWFGGTYNGFYDSHSN